MISKKFSCNIDELLPKRFSKNILAAVSGGGDSTALLCLLAPNCEKNGKTLHVIHVNHHQRGADSNRDAKFVEKLCGERGVSFHLADLHENPRREKEIRAIGLEAALRNERHEAYRKILGEIRGGILFEGHTADDRAENMLLRILRGTSIAGLSGMRAVTNFPLALRTVKLLRPLLIFSRKEVREFLRENQIQWREDGSNMDSRFVRNRIRLELIPLLEKRFNPGIRSSLATTANILEEEDRYLDSLAQAETDKIFNVGKSPGRVRARDFLLLPAVIQKRVILKMLYEIRGNGHGSVEHKQVQNLVKFIREKKHNRRFQQIPGCFVEWSGRYLVFSARGRTRISEKLVSRALPAPPFRVRIAKETRVLWCKTIRETGMEDIRKLSSPMNVFIDASRIEGALHVRHRTPGDRFFPLGYPRKTKLKDFLINQKIPACEREKILLLCDERKILWVIGIRISQDVSVTGETGDILQLNCRRMRARGKDAGVRR